MTGTERYRGPVTTASVRPPAPTDDERALASVIPSVAGVPWYGAVGVSLVLTVIGVVIAGTDFGDGVPVLLWIFFLAGTILAVLAVRRRSVFTAMVQPPLISALVVFLISRFGGDGGTLEAAVNVVKIFPMMVVATGVAVVLGFVRIATAPLKSVDTADRAGADSATA